MGSGFLPQVHRLGLEYSENQLIHIGKIDEAMARFYKLTFSSTIVRDYFQALSGPREIKEISDYATGDAKLHCDEINRMAIVFLHSMVEEIIRSFVFQAAIRDPQTLVRWFLSRQEISTCVLQTALQEAITEEEVMSRIAMAKLSVTTEAALVKKVSSRLSETLQRTSIQGIGDINKMLSICNHAIDDYFLRRSETVIAQICSRRNLIVHNMDEKDGEPLSVDVETIDEWADQIRDFLMIAICGSENNRAMQIEEQAINEGR
jgi:hypothetical protein